MSSRLHGFACALLVLAPTAVASAYCRTKTCELGMEPDGKACPESVQGCERDEHCCAVDGADLAWASPCIEFAVQADGSRRHGIDAEDLANAALEAFRRWQNVECPGGGSPRFEAQLSGFVECDQHQTACRRAKGNVSTVIAFDEIWEHGNLQLGLTTPAAVIDTGEIVDADVELNLTQGAYSIEPGTPGYDELAHVLAHELGHFMGLGHSDQPDALMYFARVSTRGPEELLSADDVEAICAVFPPSDQPLECAPSAGPAYDQCLVEGGDGTGAAAMGMDEATCIDVADDLSDDPDGCAIAGHPNAGGPGLAGVLWVASCLGWAYRRRRHY